MLKPTSWQESGRWRGRPWDWDGGVQPSPCRRTCCGQSKNSWSEHPKDLFRVCPSSLSPRDFFFNKKEESSKYFFKSSNDFQCLLLVADSPKRLEINQKELLGIALVSREPPVNCEDNTEKCFPGLEIRQARPGKPAQVVFLWWFWFS